ncbi:hypothetical protein [Catenulispora pinisilvae]|uniref:hypothetical protein n=1 Tax=Catenulispora pinisilvae TaxID=2705253 RepID=UPI001891AF23|nr:hypothetical protein [Catenulispora pinisilvae]
MVVPTIELLVQTLEAYRAVRGGLTAGAVAVCSDPTIADLELLVGQPDTVVITTAEVLAGAVAVAPGSSCCRRMPRCRSWPRRRRARGRRLGLGGRR